MRLIRLLRIREYVDAWAERAASNAAAPGVLPSNVGLDGVVGSAAEGCWYGGCCELSAAPDSVHSPFPHGFAGSEE